MKYGILMSIFMSWCAMAESPRIGLVLDKGGKDDKSFNASAYAGALRAQKELGIDFKFVEATDNNSIENLHRQFARRNFDLIIGVGFIQLDGVKKVAKEFPQKKFAIVDAELSASNVRSLLFEEHEGSYLVGVLAALHSTSNIFGFIGGMDIPLIRRFQLGYEAGIKSIRPQAKILTGFLGVTPEAWNNPPKAKELALGFYNQGAANIFVAAGASGAGVFDAAEEKKKLAIGVDSNQNWIKPGFILTSMLKRVDVAVFETIKSIKENRFSPGVLRFGLKDKGIDLAFDEHNSNLVAAKHRKAIDEIREQIINGKIKVPDYYQEKKK